MSDLDYARVKQDLMNNAAANEKRQIYLLQALRWRLTNAESIVERQQVMKDYIKGDLLNCHNYQQKTTIIGLLNSKNEIIKEFMARLINSFASLNLGFYYYFIFLLI